MYPPAPDARSDEPRLPQELERVIFELAAHNDRLQTLPVLMLVAHRVRIWVNPIRYEVVVLVPSARSDSQSILYQQRTYFPSGSRTTHVKHLLYDQDEYQAIVFDFQDFLQTCHNLQDVALWGEPPEQGTATLESLTAALQSPLRSATTCGLRCLSASLKDLFGGGKVDWTHPVFEDLTHLEILDHPKELGQWVEGNNITCIKNLKYLLLVGIDMYDSYPFPDKFLSGCLGMCKKLEVMMLIDNDLVKRNLDKLPRMREILGSDGKLKHVPESRVVVVSMPSYLAWVDDWYRGACGGDDIWTRGEKEVKQRRQEAEHLVQ